MTTSSPFENSGTPVVEVLRTPVNAVAYGYRVGGYKAGPHLLIAGHGPVAQRIFDRIVALPTVGWMRGTLSLIKLDALEETGLLFSSVSVIDPKPDEMLFLPYQMDQSHHAAATAEGYWSSLRHCAQLGMITGRGIPNAKPSQDEAPE